MKLIDKEEAFKLDWSKEKLPYVAILGRKETWLVGGKVQIKA